MISDTKTMIHYKLNAWNQYKFCVHFVDTDNIDDGDDDDDEESGGHRRH